MDQLLNILIVEDDSDVREVLKDYLEMKIKAVFDFATNGAEGLEKIKAGKYDLIITDNQMPTMTGIELIKTLDKENIPVKKVVIHSGDIFIPQLSISGKKVDIIQKAGMNTSQQFTDLIHTLKAS